jgi:hypothetical protein
MKMTREARRGTPMMERRTMTVMRDESEKLGAASLMCKRMDDRGAMAEVVGYG